MGFSIAIDGPAGAGKSTMAKAVAKKLNFIYVDTGAMYRAMALFLIRNQVSAQDMDGISSRCQDADITIKYENNEQVIYLNGENVNGLIRTEEVGNMASASSVNKEVRLKLVDLQRKLAQTADVVMDGRDIGTHVLPQAELKIYLTADAGVRAQRRCIELEARGIASDVDRIKRDIMERDERDMTREISPLCQAEDAILIDTSEMSIDHAVEAIMQLYYKIK